jgi:hypothetical protein
MKKKNTIITEEEKIKLVVIEQEYKAVIQDYLNAYEIACMLYLDNKVDRTRFHKAYKDVIRQIKTTAIFSDYIDSYNAIITVYNRWENLEK